MLIVDDDPICRLFCAETLASAGYAVLTAGDGSSGCRLAQSERPGVILIDLHLPDMSGIEAMTGILEAWRDASTAPRFVGLSGDDSIEMHSAMLKNGFTVVAVKPIGIEKLLAVVRTAGNQESEAFIASDRDREHAGSGFATSAPNTSSEQLRLAFRQELKRQIAELDEVTTLLNWQRAAEIVHRLSGAAALAGHTAFASCGRTLMRQLNCPQDSFCLAESYLDYVSQAMELLERR